MKHNFSTFAFLIAFFFVFFDHLSSSNLIHDSCEKAANTDPNLGFKLCVKSFEANPRSRNASSLEELFIISMELTISNATNISWSIKQLLASNNFDMHTEIALQDCLELYLDANSTLQDAVNDFRSRDYEGASVKISSAMDASTTCEDGFKEKKGESLSPLTKKNNIFFQLTAISLSFIGMFH